MVLSHTDPICSVEVAERPGIFKCGHLNARKSITIDIAESAEITHCQNGTGIFFDGDDVVCPCGGIVGTRDVDGHCRRNCFSASTFGCVGDSRYRTGVIGCRRECEQATTGDAQRTHTTHGQCGACSGGGLIAPAVACHGRCVGVIVQHVGNGASGVLCNGERVIHRTDTECRTGAVNHNPQRGGVALGSAICRFIGKCFRVGLSSVQGVAGQCVGVSAILSNSQVTMHTRLQHFSSTRCRCGTTRAGERQCPIGDLCRIAQCQRVAVDGGYGGVGRYARA